MEHIIDATNKKLGRLASEVAVILQGKKSTNYEPRLRGEDRVIIKNLLAVVLTGGKESKKVYYRHTGYMGHLKEELFKDAFQKSPEKVFRSVVEHMLPKNSLKPKRMKMLTVEK